MNVSRRAFISRGSLGLLLGGVAAAVPGLGAMLRFAPAPSSASALSLSSEPLVAHVRDMGSGEISLMVGTDKVVVRDLELAQQLYGAVQTRKGVK